MGKFINLTGEVFGRLKVLRRTSNQGNKVKYTCICECGNEKDVVSSNLKSGKISSCGCLRKETVTNKNIDNATHGMSNTKIYKVWDGIKKRASDTRAIDKDYDNYRGRGIYICEEWDKSFEEFYKWAIKSGYKEGLQIDRIDNDDGYHPNNCRFVTVFTNSMNRRTNIDESKLREAMTMYNNGISIAEISRTVGIKYSGLYQRLTGRRVSAEKIFTKNK